jgi:hypothetical protein
MYSLMVLHTALNAASVKFFCIVFFFFPAAFRVTCFVVSSCPAVKAFKC